MGLQIGDTAPPFVAPELKYGIPIALDNYLGKTTVVAFSGLSWCPPCQFEAPILQELWESLGSAVQFIVISVNDESKAAIENAVQQFGLTMPVIQDDSSIAADWIYEQTPQGTSWSVPRVFVLQPAPAAPLKADHHVVCNIKLGASPPEAELKADLQSKINGCSSGGEEHYWEEYNPIPWLDPGPLHRMRPVERDVLISLGISDLARHLSNPGAARRLERLAADAMFEAARAARAATRSKTVPPRDMESIETGSVKGKG